MITRLIQRTTGVSEERIEYEYEYRDAEYEYEPNAESWRTKRCDGAGMTFRFFAEIKITGATSAR